MNVLIADDDPIMIHLLSSGLRKAGFATFVAFDVMQAIMTIRRSRVDAVVLDINMPGGSGRDVIHRLKASNRTAQIPIVVVSGSLEPEARDTLLQGGAADFFSKPPDIAAVIASLWRLLAADAVASTSVGPGPEAEESYCGA